MTQLLRSLSLALSALSTAGILSVGCAAPEADSNEDTPVSVQVGSGELDTEGTGPFNCDPVAIPPTGVGFSIVGTKRLAVTTGGVTYCGYDDLTLAPGEKSYITGRLRTKACTSSSPTWTVYQSATAVAICKPGTLRLCNPTGGVPQYMASCVSTLTFPGNPDSTSANVWANLVLSKSTSTGWQTLLNYRASSEAGKTGNYLAEIYDSSRYLTWGSSGLAYGRPKLPILKGSEIGRAHV